jgi:ABC-2 type transport system permease protein
LEKLMIILSRLVRSEARLFIREPVSLLFVLAFPALVVLILGGVFDAHDPAFGGATPSDFYIAAYVGVVVAAVAFVMLPVHLASYRERGVLRRFEASHFPPWALPAAWAVVASGLCLAGIAVMLGTAQLVYGVPAVTSPATTLAAITVAIAAYVSVGILLGLVLPTARAAEGVGLAIFFVSFLLGGGGPPPGAMPAVMRTISNLLPVTQAVRSIQGGWLAIGGSPGPRIALTAGIGVAATAAWVIIASRRARR